MSTDMADMTGRNPDGAVEAALSDDGSGLVLTRELARVLGCSRELIAQIVRRRR